MKNCIMKRLGFVFLLGFVFVCESTGVASAATIFESGTLGPTGLPQGSVIASNITPAVFAGVRFQLTETVNTTQIGGHFVDENNDTFFGAIVQLDDENDFPDSADLSSTDVLGHTELTFPVPSDEVFGDLKLSLDPGWYALVFGSGLFGVNGDGAAPLTNPDIATPQYIAFQPSVGWLNLEGFLSDFRFVVQGNVVPEPTSCKIFALSSLCLLISRRK